MTTDRLAALLIEVFPAANRNQWPFAATDVAAALIAAGVRVAPSDKDAMEGVACDWDEDGNCRCVRVALSPTEAMGAAAMAEYMASWSGVAPSPTNLGQQTVYSTSLGERIVGFIEHGYTCGECNWGRANQPRSLSDYVAHVNAEHPIGPHRDFPESRVAPSPETPGLREAVMAVHANVRLRLMRGATDAIYSPLAVAEMVGAAVADTLATFDPENDDA